MCVTPGVRGRAVPVLDARGNPDRVALAHLYGRFAPLADKAAAFGDYEHLTARVRMPRRARSGLECYFARGNSDFFRREVAARYRFACEVVRRGRADALLRFADYPNVRLRLGAERAPKEYPERRGDDRNGYDFDCFLHDLPPIFCVFFIDDIL